MRYEWRRGGGARLSLSVSLAFSLPFFQLTKDDGLGAPVVGGGERAEAFLRKGGKRKREKNECKVEETPKTKKPAFLFSLSLLFQFYLARRVPDRQLQALALELQELEPEVDACALYVCVWRNGK